ncbi:NB-ARC domain-containing protein [Actinosynnema sp. NPDC020468]|uniref:ATP-binding protein n=1 Tax=Actinosynnema sp. NPDC020468 TaxID=3154488 RepID=UPI00340393B7
MAVERPEGSGDAGSTENRLDVAGGVGDLVQARDVHGDVHIHRGPGVFAVVPRQLPGYNRGFVNRASELAELTASLARQDDPGVVVITGTAGVGKTSLALRWAHALRERFPDGQLYVNLRGHDPDPPVSAADVLGRFLRDFGVPARAVPRDVEDRASLFRSILADKQVLVLLDNAATVRQVRPLLPGSRRGLVVVTSRSRLSGLIAREGATRLQVDLLGDEDSVTLLREVTAAHRRDDDPRELRELAGLCARLPLALRIAAERAAGRPWEPLSELIADLRDESGLWEALTPDGGDEADAVRGVFAWSYRALPARSAVMFRLLGLHPGDEFGVPAAAALAGVGQALARQDLESLVGAQLLEHSAPRRYRFHDLLRAYAVDELRAFEPEVERERAVRRMVSWYLHTADEAQRLIAPHDRYVLTLPVPADTTPLRFADHDAAVLWQRTEATNLVSAVRIAARYGLHAHAWRFAAVLRAVYMHQNAFDDWLAVATIGAASAAALGDADAESQAHDTLGKLHFQTRRLADAEHHHRAALALRRASGDRLGEAITVNALGLLWLRHRDLDRARADFTAAAVLAAELGEARWEALIRCNLAEALTDAGEHDAAIALLERLLVEFREQGDRVSESNALYNLARASRGAGRLTRARTAINGALAIAVADDNEMWRAHWLAELALLELADDRPADALLSSQQSAVIQRGLGDRSREALALDASGLAYQALHRHGGAVGFHRLAAATHRTLGDRWHLAVALDHLTDALTALGLVEEAATARAEALGALEDFPDRVAESLRAKLTAR